jgi:hypothetical protein
MLKAIPLLVVLATAAFAQGPTNDEAKICTLEKAYWEYEARVFESQPTQSL